MHGLASRCILREAKIIEQLLDQGASLSEKDWSGSEPLHYTLTGEDYGSMLLLARSADPNVKSDRGVSFLHGVCEEGIAWLLPPLLEYGADLAVKDGNGCNSLHRAAYFGQWEVVDIILRQGNAASITTALDNNESMPFHHAVWNGDAEIVSALLDKGAIDSAPIADGRTPLHLASREGNYDVAKLLFERK